jgi:hypothetical protein
MPSNNGHELSAVDLIHGVHFLTKGQCPATPFSPDFKHGRRMD